MCSMDTPVITFRFSTGTQSQTVNILLPEIVQIFSDWAFISQI